MPRLPSHGAGQDSAGGRSTGESAFRRGRAGDAGRGSRQSRVGQGGPAPPARSRFRRHPARHHDAGDGRPRNRRPHPPARAVAPYPDHFPDCAGPQRRAHAPRLRSGRGRLHDQAVRARRSCAPRSASSSSCTASRRCSRSSPSCWSDAECRAAARHPAKLARGGGDQGAEPPPGAPGGAS